MAYHNAGQAMPGPRGFDRIRAREACGHVGRRKTVAGRRGIDDGRVNGFGLDRMQQRRRRRRMLAGSESFSTTSVPGIRASKASLLSPG